MASRLVAAVLRVEGNSHSLYMQCMLLQYEERKEYIRVRNSQNLTTELVYCMALCVCCAKVKEIRFVGTSEKKKEEWVLDLM